MDAAVVIALHGWAVSQPWLTSAVVFVAEDGIFLIPLLLVAVWATAPTDDGRRAAIIAGCIAAVLAAGLGLYLERTLTRPRPFVELGFTPLFPHAADSSFPSDHTLVGVALTGALLIRAPRVGVMLFALAVLVGFARAAVGVHYPSDIVGSAVIALALAALVALVVRRLLPMLPVNLQTHIHRIGR
jgi:undecaprenyl-diphosphatase